MKTWHLTLFLLKSKTKYRFSLIYPLLSRLGKGPIRKLNKVKIKQRQELGGLCIEADI